MGMPVPHLPSAGMIGRQSDTRTGVDNHALRWRVNTLEALVRDFLKSHQDGECECVTCVDARNLLASRVMDVLLEASRR